LYAAIALSFVVYGPALRAMLLWLAASLAIGLTLCFAATIPPSHYLLGGCDALSTAHLVGGLAGATAWRRLQLACRTCARASRARSRSPLRAPSRLPPSR